MISGYYGELAVVEGEDVVATRKKLVVKRFRLAALGVLVGGGLWTFALSKHAGAYETPSVVTGTLLGLYSLARLLFPDETPELIESVKSMVSVGKDLKG